MAEIGDIIACRGDKYLVIAYIKPPVESGVVLDAVNEALSFEDYAKRLGKVRGYYCVSLNDNNTIYYIQNNFDILLTGNDVQSEQDNNSIFYMQGNFFDLWNGAAVAVLLNDSWGNLLVVLR